MPRIVVEIELGNDAMKTGNHVGDALRDLGGYIRHDIGRNEPTCRDEGKIRDVNGNTVGFWRVDPSPGDSF